MRLGIVGMLPGDFRTFSSQHFQDMMALDFSGAGFHFPGDLVHEVTQSEISKCKALFAGNGVALAQFSITYNECLFALDRGIREKVSERICRGAQICSQLGGMTYLLRPGSRNPSGPWTPHRENHTPEAMDLLIETLRSIVPYLEDLGVTAVMETHCISILNTPETCRTMIDEIASPNLRLVMDAVNHFECLRQVYDSTAHFGRIFEAMGAFGPVSHIKDIQAENGLVVHLAETVPGEGELDLHTMLQLYQSAFPDGYGLIEHLSVDKIPQAARNVKRIAAEASVSIS
jgi:sugar phosphate isomerase/epimerase